MPTFEVKKRVFKRPSSPLHPNPSFFTESISVPPIIICGKIPRNIKCPVFNHTVSNELDHSRPSQSLWQSVNPTSQPVRQQAPHSHPLRLARPAPARSSGPPKPTLEPASLPSSLQDRENNGARRHKSQGRKGSGRRKEESGIRTERRKKKEEKATSPRRRYGVSKFSRPAIGRVLPG